MQEVLEEKGKKTEVKFDEGDTRERKAENSRRRLEREELKDNRWTTSCRSLSKWEEI